MTLPAFHFAKCLTTKPFLNRGLRILCKLKMVCSLSNHHKFKTSQCVGSLRAKQAFITTNTCFWILLWSTLENEKMLLMWHEELFYRAFLMRDNTVFARHSWVWVLISKKCPLVAVPRYNNILHFFSVSWPDGQNLWIQCYTLLE